MRKPVFAGSGVALVTPFDKDGVNYPVFGELIEFQIENGSDAIIVGGTTGEPCTMPTSEHLDVIDYAVKKVAGRVPVIAGTGSNDTAYGLDLSKEAQNLGADALLMVTPYYNKTTQAGLIKHFNLIADAVDIPIIVYNVPSRTGLCVAAETLSTLSNHPNITAVKEASGNLALVAKIAALCGDRLDIYSGNDDVNIPIMSLGGKGVISVLANIAPKKAHDMIAKYSTGDVEGAKNLQLEAMELIEALFVEVNPIPVKTALALMGFNVGALRLPLCEMSAEGLAILKKAMQNYGLL